MRIITEMSGHKAQWNLKQNYINEYKLSHKIQTNDANQTSMTAWNVRQMQNFWLFSCFIIIFPVFTYLFIIKSKAMSVFTVISILVLNDFNFELMEPIY